MKTDSNQFAEAAASELTPSIESEIITVAAPLDGGITPSQRSLMAHWARIRAERISASEFMKFLQPLADLEGLSVSYPYRK